MMRCYNIQRYLKILSQQSIQNQKVTADQRLDLCIQLIDFLANLFQPARISVRFFHGDIVGHIAWAGEHRAAVIPSADYNPVAVQD